MSFTNDNFELLKDMNNWINIKKEINAVFMDCMSTPQV